MSPILAVVYTVLMSGNRAGQMDVDKLADGKRHVFYELNDRGRGPKLETTITLDAQGFPARIEVTGVDYFKGPADESFAVTAGVARWKNQAENGERRLPAPAYYIAFNGTPYGTGLLAKKLAGTTDGELALLPDGKARLARLVEKTVSGEGGARKVTMYELAGMDLTPTYVWLDAEDELFASGDDWLMTIRRGFEPVVPELIAAQTAAQAARARALAQKLAHRPSGVLFRNATIFDAPGARLVPGRDVLVMGNKIASVSAAGRGNAPAGVEVIDATGKTLLPGLWDMHAHVQAADGMLNLAAGVTTVRDLANDTELLLARMQRVAKGEELGTRVVLAGFMDGPGPFQGPTKVLVSTPDEVRAALDNYKRTGHVQVKVYSSIKPELVPVIIAEAHKRGMRVSGHIPSGMTAAECVKLGFDEIQHANFLMLNFMPEVTDTRTPARFSEPARRGAELDLSSPPVRDFIALLKRRGTASDPTLNIFESLFTDRPGKIPLGYAPIADRLPVMMKRSLLAGGLPVPEGMDQRYRDSFAAMLRLVKALDDAGVPIELGTDSLAGFGLLRELELHVQAGIPAARTLRNATWGAAKIMKLDDRLGSIAAGKLADLVLVNGDPVASISAMRAAVLTMKDGVVYRPAELRAELGIGPDKE